MSGIIIEKEIGFEDLAETINNQLDRTAIMFLLTKLSEIVDDPDFDKAASDLFAAQYEKRTDMHDLNEAFDAADECGVSVDHKANSAGTECRVCGADLSEWEDEDSWND